VEQQVNDALSEEGLKARVQALKNFL